MTFASLALGGYHSCGLTADGMAYCWGANGSGQLGDGTYEERDTPVAVSTPMRFASLSLGDFHSCGRTRGGAVYCWGADSSGQLGDGSGAISWPAPVLVRW
jgi:alpha-tubulin suppressor-like RCC1 family protein